MTFLSISAKIGFTAKDFAVNPGVAQLVGRLVWELEHGKCGVSPGRRKTVVALREIPVWNLPGAVRSGI